MENKKPKKEKRRCVNCKDVLDEPEDDCEVKKSDLCNCCQREYATHWVMGHQD